MCGRFYVDYEVEELQNLLGDGSEQFESGSFKRGEVFPSDRALVLLNKDKSTVGRLMAWGFPKWDGRGVIFNARAETALKKTMFRKPLLEHPVAVPVSGFFEWKIVQGQKKKDKYLFRSSEKPFFCLAGFYNIFAAGGGAKAECFTILTMPANSFMLAYHDRMPVLLDQFAGRDWLNGTQSLNYFLERAPLALEAEKIGG